MTPRYIVIGPDLKEQGPFGIDQIKLELAAGRLHPETLAQAEGTGEWKPLRSYAELSDHLNAPGSAPPRYADITPPLTAGIVSRGAIASLVLGLLGFLGITALIGFIIGMVSLGRISRSQGALRGKALAWSGTVLSALFLLLFTIAIVAGIPALIKMKTKAQSIVCMNNMKQLCLGALMFAGDNGDHFPQGTNWCDALQQYIGNSMICLCPGGDPATQCHYAFNDKLSGTSLKKVESAAQTVMFFETDGGWNLSGGPELVVKPPRHKNCVGVAFVDGHSEIMPAERLGQLRWDP